MATLRNSAVASTPLPGESDRIQRQITVSARPGRVWNALTRPAELAAWFGGDMDIEGRPGGRVTLRRPDGWERSGVVEDVEDARRLSFRWLPFERAADGAVRVLGPGRVEFRLEQVEAGTLVRVTEWVPTGTSSRASSTGRSTTWSVDR
jgi:uncharacterized protein YndB with AHSA1/START domain